MDHSAIQVPPTGDDKALKRVLFLTNLPPYPLDNGGKIKTDCSIRALSENGIYIDMLAFNEEGENADKKAKDHYESQNIRCFFIPAKLTTAAHIRYMIGQAFKSLFTGLPFAVEKYKKKQMRNMVKALCDKNSYDLVYIEHLQMAIYRNDIPIGVPVLLDEQNCESEIARQRLELNSSWLKRIFLHLEYEKMTRFEAKCLNYADKVLTLSEQDCDRLRSLAPDADYSIIPIGLEDHGVKSYRNQRHPFRLLFMGTMTWQANSEGIEWFVRNVYPSLTDVELVIVGKGISEKLRTISEEAGANVLGYVEAVDAVYEFCDAMVVPLFMGSGQRVKILEALSRGMPVVSTSIGAEGIAVGKSGAIMIANNQDEFERVISKLAHDSIYEVAAKEAREIFLKKYSSNAVSERIFEVVESLYRNYVGNDVYH